VIDKGNDAPAWIESVLGEFDAASASRYRGRSSFLERSFAGISDDAKINALRLMVNLGVPPDDVSSMLGILYGHIVAAGEEIPRSIREASADVSRVVDAFVRESMTFQLVVADTQKEVYKDVHANCEQLAEALEQHQLRLRATTESTLKQFLENALRERQKIAVDSRSFRERVLTGLAACLVLLAGWASGAGWGSLHAHGSTSEQQTVAYGKEFIAMYPAMPASMQAWVKSWTAHHSR
jgi:hypothetical protein